jgi:hypothetical protein
MKWPRNISAAGESPLLVERRPKQVDYNSKSSNEMSREDVIRRLEQYYRVADLRCCDCGEWTSDPLELGIHDEAQWKARMAEDMLWMRDNRDAVLDALPFMKPEWDACCEALRGLFRRAGKLRS